MTNGGSSPPSSQESLAPPLSHKSVTEAVHAYRDGMVEEHGNIIFQQQTSLYSAPFPPADEMEKYINIGISQQIMDFIIQEAQHRRQCDSQLIAHSIQIDQQAINLQKNVMEQNDRLKSRGQLFAFLIALFGIMVSAYLAVLSPWVAGLIASFTLVVMVGTFINNDFSWDVMKYLPLGQMAKKKEGESPDETAPPPHE